MAEMIVRDATLEDVAALVAHGREFLISAMPAGYSYDEAGAAALVSGLIVAPAGLVVVAERDGRIVGGLVAIAYKAPFCVELQAREIAWWVEPSARGSRRVFDMIDRLEEFGAATGCKHVVLSTIDSVSPDALNRFLTSRRGYQHAENAFIRAV